MIQKNYNSNIEPILKESKYMYYLVSFMVISISVLSSLSAIGRVSSGLLQAGQAIIVLITYIVFCFYKNKITVSSLILIVLNTTILMLNLAPYMISLSMLIMLYDIGSNCSNVELKKLLKVFLITSLILFFSIFTLSLFFNFNNHDMTMWRIDKLIYRKSLGFNHPNIASIIWMSIFFACVGVIGKNNIRIKMAGLILLSGVILNLTQSRTSLYVIFIIGGIIFFLGNRIYVVVHRKIGIFSRIIPIFFIFASFMILILPINATLNDILSGRIELYQSFYKEYGIHLFETRALESAMFDNGYLQALLSKGILFFVELFVVFFYIFYSRNVFNMKQLLLIFGFFSVGFTETALQHFELVLPVLFTVLIVPEKTYTYKSV